MIGYLAGEVLFSDGNELILKTKDGIGYQVHLNEILTEGSVVEIFTSHVIREASQDLYGFKTLRDKKLFEVLTSVKGVGPKSAYSLIASLGTESIIQAVTFENKKVLTKAPGVGAKAAAQICLDLSGKIQKVMMYAVKEDSVQMSLDETLKAEKVFSVPPSSVANQAIIDDAVMACKELGFKEDHVLPLVQKLLAENEIKKPEQLIHLVLKEM